MTKGLAIAPELTLPIEAVTETFAILAKRGKGKTNTAVVMAEEMIGANLPVVVIDPIGVWWGLRSSAEGGPGLPVVIFGGDHADVPLEESAGELIADVIVDQRFPAVIDLGGLSKSGQRRFMTPFLERLYHRNRDALHVIIDEADAFAPQRAQADGARLLGAMEDLVRRGRARGLGVTLITQRPASLNKDVLTQAEVLITLGMTGPRDVQAIDEWVRLHADEDQAREVKKSLPSLQVGNAWVWSPGWLDILQRVQIRPRQTFDSSATPKPGQQRRAPKARAEVDLAALGAQITATVERKKAEDPKALRRRVADLERELAAERAKPKSDPVVEQVEVPLLDGDWREAFSETVDQLLERLSEVEARMRQYPSELPSLKQRRPAQAIAPRVPAPQPQQQNVTPNSGGALPKAHLRILTALAQHGPKEKIPLAILTGYSHKGGGFNNPLGALRSANCISSKGVNPIEITQHGIDVLGDYEPLPTGRALLDWWLPQLSGAEKKIVGALDEGGPMDKVTLANAAGYSPVGGGFNNPLGHLRTLGIITPAKVSPIALAPEMSDS